MKINVLFVLRKCTIRFGDYKVVAGELPNTYTDRFSLTVILFLLLYGNHPFEGERVLAQPCMRESDEKRFFGYEMLFIYHPIDSRNRPVHGIHNNVIRRWNAFPAVLRNQFLEEFSHEKLYANPQSRLIEAEWVRLLQNIKDHIALCPYCHQETFVDDQNATRCVSCGTLLQVKVRMKFDGRHLPLIAGNQYDLGEGIKFDAVLSTTDKLLWLRNTSKNTWQVMTTKGEQRPLAPKALMPAKSGIRIQFNSTLSADIK